MTWTLEGPALDEIVQVTSTATVRVAASLHMFGLDPWQLAGDRRAIAPVVPTSACAPDGPTLTFLQARAVLEAPTLSVRGEGLHSSCIPSRRHGVRWAVSGQREAELDVVYKDPSIVQLPDDTWLMVLARYRAPAAPKAPGPGRPGRFPDRPGGAIGDIVAWRAADPTFTTGLTGPFPLLDSRRADPDGAEAWLGVPGAIVRGPREAPHLDLYYVIERSGDVRSRLDPQHAPSTQARPGLGVARFEWADLRDQLAHPVPEDGWERTGMTIPSTLLGRVAVWWPGAPGEVEPLEARFPQPALKVADPAPLDCPSGDPLFFAAIFSGPPDGAAHRAPPGGGAQGVWRGAPLPADAELCVREGATCAPLTVREGLDYLVGPDDRLVTTTETGVYLDPDPVRLFWGGARVRVGNLAERGGLTAFHGTAADLCGSWRRAW